MSNNTDVVPRYLKDNLDQFFLVVMGMCVICKYLILCFTLTYLIYSVNQYFWSSHFYFIYDVVTIILNHYSL